MGQQALMPALPATVLATGRTGTDLPPEAVQSFVDLVAEKAMAQSVAERARLAAMDAATRDLGDR